MDRLLSICMCYNKLIYVHDMYNNIINMLYIIMTARTCGQLKNATRKHPYIPMGADHPRFNRFPGPPADPAWDQTA